jgi:hypothetical protein
MAVGDFTVSGNPDVAVIGHSPFVQVFLGDGKGHLQPAQQYPLSSDAKGIAAADVTGDGTLDLVTAGRNAVLTLPGNGDGGFGTAISSPCPDCNGLIVVADVNHDGKLDVITTNNEGVVVLFGNGDGTFQTGTVYPISRPSSLAAGDLNGDGNLDLVVTSDSEMHGVFIFYGAANGTFGTPVPLNNGGSGAIVADFNNDGYLDIAMSFDGRLAVYLGNGNGTFSAPLLEKARVFPPLLAGDFNGDGTLDIVGIHSALPGNTAILLGNGDGTFTGQNQTYLLDSGYADAFQFAAGYFNAGGQLDLVSTNGGGNAVWLLVNTTP